MSSCEAWPTTPRRTSVTQSLSPYGLPGSRWHRLPAQPGVHAAGSFDQAVRYNRPAIPGRVAACLQVVPSAKEGLRRAVDGPGQRRRALDLGGPPPPEKGLAKSGSGVPRARETSVGSSASRSRRKKGTRRQAQTGTGSGTLPGAATLTVAGTVSFSPSCNCRCCGPAGSPIDDRGK